MLHSLALVPDSPVLIPGVGGREHPAPAARDGALRACAKALEALPRHAGVDPTGAAIGVGRVVLVGAGDRFDSGWVHAQDLHVGLGELGVPDRLLPAELQISREDVDAIEVPTALVAPLWLALANGWDGPVRLVLLPGPQSWVTNLDLGMSLTNGPLTAVLCAGGRPVAGHTLPYTGQAPWQLAAALAKLHADWLPPLRFDDEQSEEAAQQWAKDVEWQGEIGQLWTLAAAWVVR